MGEPPDSLFPFSRGLSDVHHKSGAAGSRDRIKITSRPGLPDKVVVKTAGKARNRGFLDAYLGGEMSPDLSPNARMIMRARDPAVWMNFPLNNLSLRIEWTSLLTGKSLKRRKKPRPDKPGRKDRQLPDQLAQDLVNALRGDTQKENTYERNTE